MIKKLGDLKKNWQSHPQYTCTPIKLIEATLKLNRISYSNRIVWIKLECSLQWQAIQFRSLERFNKSVLSLYPRYFPLFPDVQILVFGFGHRCQMPSGNSLKRLLLVWSMKFHSAAHWNRGGITSNCDPFLLANHINILTQA